MILLARMIDPPAREVRKTYDEKVDEPMKQAYAKIAKAYFAVKGTDTYPDATFTLRLAFGEVKGYKEDGKSIPPWTTIGGAFQHADNHGSKPPFQLPSTWLNPPKALNMDTPFNFVARPTSSAATAAARWSTRRANIAASFSTATSSRWCSISCTPTSKPGP